MEAAQSPQERIAELKRLAGRAERLSARIKALAALQPDDDAAIEALNAGCTIIAAHVRGLVVPAVRLGLTEQAYLDMPAVWRWVTDERESLLRKMALPLDMDTVRVLGYWTRIGRYYQVAKKELRKAGLWPQEWTETSARTEGQAPYKM